MLFRRWLRALKLASQSQHRGRNRARKPRAVKPLLEALEDRCVPSTFIVTTTADSGAGSLRQAILNSNSTPGANTIDFQLSSSQPAIISPLSPLPAITNPVTIDGLMTSGGVTLEPTAMQPVMGPGLDFEAGSGGSTVEDFTIADFQGNGVTLASNGNTLEEFSTGYNQGDGVAITNAASGNTIVASSIGYNAMNGVEITNAASGNMILSNNIGFNAMNGVAIDAGARNNQVGSTSGPGQNNEIGNNTLDGILITGSGTNANSIQGNNLLNNGQYGLEITAGASGNSAAGAVNSEQNTNNSIEGNADGVVIDSGATNNTVSGYTISSNTTAGVLLTDSGTSLNKIEEDHIGTDAMGTYSDGNVNGVVIQGGASQNTLQGNVISGNSQNGVVVSGSGTTNNTILGGNKIGSNGNATGALPNQGDGVMIDNGASGTLIGQVTVFDGFVSASGNTISGNGHDGILITGSSTTGNTVQADFIGVVSAVTGGTAAMPNQGSGVEIAAGASGNTIGGTGLSQGNTIADNGSSTAPSPTGGVLVDSGTGNAIRGNAIYANIGIGIDLGDRGVPLVNDSAGHTGPNDDQDDPILTSVVAGTGGWLVSGNLPGPGTNRESFGLDFFTDGASDLPDQGRTYDGSATVSGTGPFSVLVQTALPVPTTSLVTATATDANGNTSEFAPALPEATTTLSVSPNPATVGQTITFSATVTAPVSSSTPTGTVAFYDGSSLLSSVALPASGPATFTTASLAVGTHNLQARFTSSNLNLLGSNSQTVSVSVQTVATTTTLTASSNPAPFGQSVTLTAVVAAPGSSLTPTGTVAFSDGGTPLGSVKLSSGQATFTTASLTVGTQSIQAAYTSDTGTFATSSSSLTLPVVFLVTTTADSGPGSLRAELQGADDAALPDAVPIDFAIPTTDPGYNASADTFTINLQSPLPILTSPVVLDGTTEPNGGKVVLKGSAVAALPLPPSSGGGSSSTASVAAPAIAILNSPNGAAGGLELDPGSDGSTVLGLTIENFGDPGILLFNSSNDTIGGTGAGQGNVITGNSGEGFPYFPSPWAAGVVVDGGSNDAVRGNNIYDNASLGISLVNNGNNSLGNPLLTSVQGTGNTATVTGTLADLPDQSVDLDFFANPAVAYPAYQSIQGAQFVGSIAVSTDAAGNFSTSLPITWSTAADPVLTATATDPYGDTSPFSGGAFAITWSAPAAVAAGSALSAAQLDASAAVPGTFTYTPAAGTVLSAGTQALSVVFTPTDTTDYTTATKTVALVVNEAFPAINGQLTVNGDQLANKNDTITLTTAAGGVVVTMDGQTAQFAPGVIHSIVVNPGVGANVVNVESTLAGVPVTIDLSGSTDIVTISPSAHNLNHIQGGVTINGGAGFDTLTVDDQANSSPGTYVLTEGATLSGSSVTRTGSAAITYNGNQSYGPLAGVLLNGGSGSDTYQVSGTPLTPVAIGAGSGSNTLYLPAASTAASLSITQSASTGSGTWTYSDNVPLTFSGIGTLNDAGTLTSIQTAAFLSHAYQDLLGRAVDFGGLTGWSGQLNAGVSRTQVALDILNGNEYHQDLVESWYQKYLGRAADPSGLSGWTSLLNSGWTNESVQAAILASQEFFQDSGSTNAGFVNNLYQDLLSRTPSSAERQGWVNALINGASRTTVALDFLTSLEYRTDLVTGYYETYLRRAPDAGGLADWVGQLNAGYTDESVLAGIIGSQEYYNKWL